MGGARITNKIMETKALSDKLVSKKRRGRSRSRRYKDDRYNMDTFKKRRNISRNLGEQSFKENVRAEIRNIG